MNQNTDSRLQQADFRNVGEAQEAIKTWNGHQSKSDRIRLTKDTGGYKNLGDLELELASRQLSFAGMKAFHDKNTKASPHKVQPRAVKETKPTGPTLVQLKKQEPQIATPLLNIPRKVKGARFAKADEVKGPLHGARLKALTDETTGATEL